MATKKIRRTGGRTETSAMWQILISMALLFGFAADGAGNIGNGTTAGFLRTQATTLFRIAGRVYSKGSTDNLWDLSAETDTTASQYRAYWLLLDSAGTASFAAGTNAASAAAALEALPALDGTKSVIGVYVAGNSTDFNGAGGLAAQGTIHQQIPEGVRLLGLKELRYVKPPVIDLVGF
ncbi:MAG TPA: hypothetical protein VEB22_15515 [Phycisphaerales bacterium]|nr:hypothetical protein [Phycisphaerales bacterium]